MVEEGIRKIIFSRRYIDDFDLRNLITEETGCSEIFNFLGEIIPLHKDSDIARYLEVCTYVFYCEDLELKLKVEWEVIDITKPPRRVLVPLRVEIVKVKKLD